MKPVSDLAGVGPGNTDGPELRAQARARVWGGVSIVTKFRNFTQWG